MTCIVGFIGENGDVAIGSDSIGINSHSLEKAVRLDPKVFNKGDAVIGCAGSFRGINVLMYQFELPRRYENQSDHEFMCTQVVPAMQNSLSSAGTISLDEGTKLATDTCMIIGYRGCLYIVYSDFQVGISARGYEAIGCGAPYALGALEGLLRLAPNIKPAKAVQLALEASEEHSAGVSAPFNVVLMKNDEIN